MNTITSLLIAACLFIGSCVNNATEDTLPHTLPRELSASEKKVISSGESFGYDIFRRTVAAEEKENVFISPLSISMALGMTLNGASGETRTAMKEALHMQRMNIEEINSSYQSLIDLLVNLDDKVKMKIANSVWNKLGFKVNETFIEQLETYFDAEIREVDFQDSKTVDVINDWVSQNTDGLIEKIVEGNIPPGIVMYLINAIYFKGNWLHEFNPEKTEKRDFNLGDGGIASVDMMNREGDIAHYISEEVVMVDLPYGDSLYTMSLMMPAGEEKNIDDFIQESLSSENVAQWHNSLQVSKRELGAPKFTMEYEKSLNDILKSMGMEVAFDELQADFSNINDESQLFISEVKHKTFVEVNEEGTEAAAVTSISIGITSAGPGPIIFDRPFVFMIRERISGTVLFMGKMGHPSD